MILHVLTVLHHAGDHEGLEEGLCELLQGLDGVQGLLHHLGAKEAGLSHCDECRHCRSVSKHLSCNNATLHHHGAPGVRLLEADGAGDVSLSDKAGDISTGHLAMVSVIHHQDRVPSVKISVKRDF